MDIEFHYYITYILARESGFSDNESYIVAYSSQYVDDNCYYYYVNFNDGSHYINEVSQTMDITKPSAKREKIYPIFHFTPGDPESPGAGRKDGRKHLFNTTPDSENVRKLFFNALGTNDLYRIGIATHVYADTWAHQNFLGMKNNFNGIPEWGIIPNIGHADARHEPDKVDNRWKDSRLIEENEVIDNNERFLEAARCIFLAYSKYRNPAITDVQISQKWEKLKTKLIKAMEETYLLGSDDRARINAYDSVGSQIPEYDPNAWRYEAVEKFYLEEDIFDRYWAKAEFDTSRWYGFQKAVEGHYILALQVLKPVYDAAGLVIRMDT